MQQERCACTQRLLCADCAPVQKACSALAAMPPLAISSQEPVLLRVESQATDRREKQEHRAMLTHVVLCPVGSESHAKGAPEGGLWMHAGRRTP